jgi:hypothetical protein
VAKIIPARVLPLIVLAAFAVSTSNAQATPSAGNADAVTPAAEPAAPELTEAAPNPPKVTCNGDQMTIVANNSTFGSVLAAVRSCAGVKIDVPDGLSGSRVFDRIGPGPAREVLTTLFDAMNFNYVIGSSDANPDKIDSVLLIARGGDTPSTGNSGAIDRPNSVSRRAWMQTRQNRAASLTPDDSSYGPVPDATAAAPEEPPPATQPDTSSTPAPAVADTTPARVEPPVSTGVDTSANKSTADQITSMQQLFEQRRQMMEKLNATKPQ